MTNKCATRILCVGNPFRSDDGAGPAVADRLVGRVPDYVKVRVLDGEGASLMAAWEGAQTVILVDAAHSGATPGTVRRFDALAAPLPQDQFRGSSHLFGVAQAVEMARSLGRLPQSFVIYAIEGANFRHGETLSPAVAKAVDEVAETLCSQLGQL